MTTLYSPITDKTIWSGRTDALNNEYVYQSIQYLDLNTIAPGSVGNSSFKVRRREANYGLLGFESDAGVIRNQGNPGAKKGPASFRRAFGKFPLHTPFNLYDAGNVTCEGDHLEAAQTELSVQVAKILSNNLTPIVIGGGHETAWGTFQGVAQHYHDSDMAILNFDAHFDLRPLINGQYGSSGTPFRQINDWLKRKEKPFNYYCAGIQPFSNTASLFQYAKTNKVHYLMAKDIHANPTDLQFIDNIIDTHQHIYVSVCLDVFSASIAPGVSAPQPLGIGPGYVIEALRRLKNSGKVISLDIVELAPEYDINAQTAKLAASLLMIYLNT